MLDTLTMCPSGRASSTGRNALVRWSVPDQLTAKTRSIARIVEVLDLHERLDDAGAVHEAVDRAVVRGDLAGQRVDRDRSVMSSVWVDTGRRDASSAVSWSVVALRSTAATRAPRRSASRHGPAHAAARAGDHEDLSATFTATSSAVVGGAGGCRSVPGGAGR